MPPGREAELWGFSTFAQVSLTWLPTIVFASLNESLGDMQLAIASLDVFFLLALIGTFTITEKSMLEHAPAGETSRSTSVTDGSPADDGSHKL
jgi:hypothetical protein